MHRTIEITTATRDTEALLRELEPLKEVTGLSIARGASLKPRGDVITVHVLNRGADAVLGLAREYGGERVSIVTAELTSIIDKQHEEAVDHDFDEAVWEEMETGLRHQGRVTTNFVALMALGGAIAAIGLVSEPAPQAIAFVAASIIAPGFEPLAKIPLGIVLGRWNVVGRGLLSSVVGYAVLILTAALVMFILFATRSVEVSELVGNPEVKNLSSPKLKEMIVSGAAAVAGMVMIASYRRSVIAGPLVALVIIHAAATIGAGLAARQTNLMLEGVERLGLDVLFIFAAGLLVFFVKQVIVHRRKPIV